MPGGETGMIFNVTTKHPFLPTSTGLLLSSRAVDSISSALHTPLVAPLCLPYCSQNKMLEVQSTFWFFLLSKFCENKQKDWGRNLPEKDPRDSVDQQFNTHLPARSPSFPPSEKLTSHCRTTSRSHFRRRVTSTAIRKVWPMFLRT